jgi:hypothetical protein
MVISVAVNKTKNPPKRAFFAVK